MILYLPEFNGIHFLYSVAHNVVYAGECLSKKQNVLFLSNGKVLLLPEDHSFDVSEETYMKLNRLWDGDVVQIDKKNICYTLYAEESSDNALVITSACNSNCRMCPISEKQRKFADISSIDELLEIARYLPESMTHLTITGGEPFLIGDSIFRLLAFLKSYRPEAKYLMLTNGRVFSNLCTARMYVGTHPDNMITGVPIHGSRAELHDEITQARGSFDQTITGIKHLLYYGDKIEIRIVVSKLNLEDIANIAEMIVHDIPEVDSVKFMGVELLGNAAVNEADVWVDYKTAFQKSQRGIDYLVSHGIDVGLYNFPLCCIPANYWGIYHLSITDNKIRYLKSCDECKERNACGGIFYGSLRMVQEVYPLLSVAE